MTPHLEDRLTQLADELVAPATPEIRSSIGRRARVLRRRRRTRQAMGAGALVAVALAGTIAVTRGTTPEAQTDYVDQPAPELPAITLDAEGWAIDVAKDSTVDALDPAGSTQVFERPDDPDGPRIVVHHHSPSDVIVQFPEVTNYEVDVSGARAFIAELADGTIGVRWSPLPTDTHAEIEAHGLSRQQVEDFANGLSLRDESISFPGGPGDEFGFAAGDLPEGFEETSGGSTDAPARRLVLTNGDRTAELTILGTGDSGIEASIEQPTDQEGFVHTTVLGHRAIISQGTDEASWWAAWQPNDRTTVYFEVTGVDRAEFDPLLLELREIPAAEWDDIVSSPPLEGSTG